MVIPPKNFHKFTGMENSIVFEIYYSELPEVDIVREDVGKNIFPIIDYN
jgi:hypothetical protein